MKKVLGYLMIAALVVSLATSCKSKQRVVNISGADIEAAEQRVEPVAPVVVEEKKEEVVSNEVTRGEKFDLAEGETANTAFERKFHVVVGSFGLRDNAKNLQQTLINEGNNALMVINEQGMYRVIIASYDEYTQARIRINDISGRFPDAWVLRQK